MNFEIKTDLHEWVVVKSDDAFQPFYSALDDLPIGNFGTLGAAVEAVAEYERQRSRDGRLAVFEPWNGNVSACPGWVTDGYVLVPSIMADDRMHAEPRAPSRREVTCRMIDAALKMGPDRHPCSIDPGAILVPPKVTRGYYSDYLMAVQRVTGDKGVAGHFQHDRLDLFLRCTKGSEYLLDGFTFMGQRQYRLLAIGSDGKVFGALAPVATEYVDVNEEVAA